jgi:hypothetical protein
MCSREIAYTAVIYMYMRILIRDVRVGYSRFRRLKYAVRFARANSKNTRWSSSVGLINTVCGLSWLNLSPALALHRS